MQARKDKGEKSLSVEEGGGEASVEDELVRRHGIYPRHFVKWTIYDQLNWFN